MPVRQDIAGLFPDNGRKPRIEPLAPGDWSPEAGAAIRLAGGVVPPGMPTPALFATLAHHPRLYERWNLFAGRILKGALPKRDREVLIVRTLWHTRCRYEWQAHCEIALVAGVSEEELEQLTKPVPAHFEGVSRWLVAAADQLHHHSDIDDETWKALAEHYSVQELIEIPMLVGQYHLVGFLTNALGFVPEAGIDAAFEQPLDELDPKGFFR